MSNCPQLKSSPNKAELHIAVPKSFYPPESVLKAAYAFIDICYVHVDETDKSWVICMSAKDTSSFDTSIAAKEFENELLSQTVHLRIYEQTHAIRELLIARAMASSMVLENDQVPPIVHKEEDISDEELNSILTNWFDNHE